MLTLNEICAVLGCSKPAASLLNAGKYDRESELKARHQALVKVVAERRGLDLGGVCLECPRQDCAGCRIAELQGL